MRWATKIANTLEWSGEIINREAKQRVASSLAAKVQNGAVVGVGSGSTVYLTLQAIGNRVREENLQITAIPTSPEVALACAALGIPTTSLFQQRPDWSFDGADEVDPNHNLIKGRGGAMFREKILLASSPKNYIVIDPSKLVDSLGKNFPVPVETYPTAVHLVETRLLSLGATDVKLRLAKAKDGPVITEAGNFILDVKFQTIAPEMEKEIKAVTGVIESGLFIGYEVEILVSDN